MSKSLVIVESPAKARTISKYLGDEYVVEASIGHIRDLPRSADEIPKARKKDSWARLGVNVTDDFKPLYIVPAEKKAHVKKLKQALSGASELLLATDEDREGESISWHLKEVLKPKVPVRRLVFHEITKTAILDALANAREINENLVEAQEARRVLDRLYGYEVSPLLWRKVRKGLSAGRVQSVAVRLIVGREKERMAFTRMPWWDVQGTLSCARGELSATLLQLNGVRLATGRDFADDGSIKAKGEVVVLDEAGATNYVDGAKTQQAVVSHVERRPYTDRPSPPFTTSTLQQDAIRKYRWTARKTMSVAQRLYENGWITYMRTDSVTLSSQALQAARNFIETDYGAENLPDKPRFYSTKSKNAQEAHEAIRPAGATFKTVSQARSSLDSDEAKLYELVWKRTIASQMANATGKRVVIKMQLGEGVLQTTGKTVEFPGFRLAYVVGTEEGSKSNKTSAPTLPDLKVGDELNVDTLEGRPHETQPPARLNEASLVKELEARGIGRPSTYASIIDTIQRRDYVFKKANALVPTFTAFAVVQLLEQHFDWLVDYEFTAKMERELDEIAVGNDNALACLKRFYSGETGLHDQLENALGTVDARSVCTIPLGVSAEGVDVEVRVGKFGPYLNAGESRANVPEDLPPAELSLEHALKLLAESQEGPQVLGVDPESGKEVTLRKGRFGPYIQLGEPEEVVIPPKTKRSKPKVKSIKPPRQSLLPGMTPESLDLAVALSLLALPRTLGEVEVTDGDGNKKLVPFQAKTGRFGPYIQLGTQTCSVPAEFSILTMTLQEAQTLLATSGKRKKGKEVLRLLGETSEGVEVKLMKGRYGPYVTNGKINASLRKGMTVEEMNLETAIEMLEKKAASPKKRGRAKRKTKKKS